VRAALRQANRSEGIGKTREQPSPGKLGHLGGEGCDEECGVIGAGSIGLEGRQALGCVGSGARS
jgi:hypothetical protein